MLPEHLKTTTCHSRASTPSSLAFDILQACLKAQASCHSFIAMRPRLNSLKSTQALFVPSTLPFCSLYAPHPAPAMHHSQLGRHAVRSTYQVQRQKHCAVLRLGSHPPGRRLCPISHIGPEQPDCRRQSGRKSRGTKDDPQRMGAAAARGAVLGVNATWGPGAGTGPDTPLELALVLLLLLSLLLHEAPAESAHGCVCAADQACLRSVGPKATAC